MWRSVSKGKVSRGICIFSNLFSLHHPGWKRSLGWFAPCMRNNEVFFLMIEICINWQYHKGQGEKQGWVLIILLFKFAVGLMLIVFNHRFKDRFQLYQGIPWVSSQCWVFLPQGLHSPEFGFSLISYFIHIILEDAVQKKEDFVQIKGWGGENPNCFGSGNSQGFPLQPVETGKGKEAGKENPRQLSVAGKALGGLSHPSLPSCATWSHFLFSFLGEETNTCLATTSFR